MNGMKVSGLGKAVPVRRVTNDELSALVDTSHEWIYSRTGIEARHVAETETTTYLATCAAKEALIDSGLNEECIDLVIVATVSPDSTMPTTACEVAKALHLTKAVCFDMAAACSGFVYATQVAHSMIQTGAAKNALVIGADVLSKVLNWEDRGSCVLFGDGAGAVVYEGTQESKVHHISLCADPTGSEYITLPTGHFSHTFYQVEEKKPYIGMQGKEVYCFATTRVPENIEEVLKDAGYTPEDIDWFVLHQANSRIIDSVAKKLKVPLDKFFKNLQEYGNTSAASIPIALCELSPQLKKGQKLILTGYGAGLTWGTMLLEWSK